MHSVIEQLKPYLLVILTLCLVSLVLSNKPRHRYYDDAVLQENFSNRNSPWSAIPMTQFLSEPSASNQRQGFESAPLAMRLIPSIHGLDNFESKPIASQLSGAIAGRGGFQGERFTHVPISAQLSGAMHGRGGFEAGNISAPIKASGAAAQLAALLKK